jgi:hypothetical protein
MSAYMRLSAAAAAVCAAVSVLVPAGSAAAIAGTGGPAPAAGTITTVAGGAGGPGPATQVALQVCGIRSVRGSLYVGDVGNVRRISESSGALTTVAGNRAFSGAGDGAAAAQVTLPGACGTAADAAGNLLLADGKQVQVLASGTGQFYGQPMTAGHVYAVAGQPSTDRSSFPLGDGGPATQANLFQAVGVTADQAGNLVIADSGQPQDCGDCTPVGALIRVVAAKTGTFYGQQMTAGDIYTVAGIQNGPAAEGNKGPATQAWLGPTIGAVRLDSAGNLVVPDNGENDVGTTIAPTVRVVAVRTGARYGQQMTAGHIYRVAGNGHYGSGGDGGPALAAPLEAAGGAAVDAKGNLVIADLNRARVIAVKSGTFYGQRMTAGDIYGIAGVSAAGYSGDGGPAVKAKISVGSVALDSAGNVVLGGGNRVRVVAAAPGWFYGQQMAASDIYTAGGTGAVYSGSGQPPVRGEFDNPAGVTADASGDLVFTASGVVWAVMARSGKFFGQNVTAGKTYVIAGNGTEGYAGDGGPAAKAEFDLNSGATVTFDPAGNVVVADWFNNRVRVVAARSGTFYGRPMTAGDIYTVGGTGGAGFSGDGGPAAKAMLNNPLGAATDHAGNLLIADGLNRRLRVVAASTGTFYGQHMTAGDIYTVAGDGNAAYSGDGGPAAKAGVSPFDAVPDAAGNLVIVDLPNRRVRLVAAKTGTFYGQQMTAGDIYTIAGSGQYGLSGNGGPATSAEFEGPDTVAVDRSGNVAITDEFSFVTWLVAARTGTFYGQNMTAGDIYIVAGNGTAPGTDGLGDGGPSTGSRLHFPDGVTFGPAGNLLVADFGDGRIRAVAG